MSESEGTADSGVAAAVSTPDAETVIKAFGGIRPMASQLGIAVSTVQGWKTRNTIPDNRWRDIIAAADAAGVDLSSMMSPPSSDAAEPATDDAGEVDETVEEESADVVVDEAADASVTDEDLADTTDDASREDMSDQQPDSPAEQTDAKPISDAKPEAPAVAAASAASATQVEKAGGSRGFLPLLLAIIALVAVAGEPYWRPLAAPHIDKLIAAVAPDLMPETVGAGVDAEALQSLADKAEAVAEMARGLESRVTAVEATTAALSGAEAKFAALEESLVALREAIAAGEAGDGSGAALAVIDLSGLETRLAALEAKPATTESDDAAGEAAAALSAELSALQTDVSALETLAQDVKQRVDAAMTGVETNAAGVLALQSTATALEATVEAQSTAMTEALAARPEVGGNAEAALMLTVGEVATAIGEGHDYAGAQARLASLSESLPEGSDGAAAAAVLTAFAPTGVASFESLAREFKRIAPAAHSRSLTPAGDGYWEQTLARMSSLVSVRLAGEGPDSPPVSNAEAAIARGDLVGAVAILSDIPGADEGTLGDWLVNAKARLSALDAARVLQSVALERFASATAGGE